MYEISRCFSFLIQSATDFFLFFPQLFQNGICCQGGTGVEKGEILKLLPNHNSPIYKAKITLQYNYESDRSFDEKLLNSFSFCPNFSCCSKSNFRGAKCPKRWGKRGDIYLKKIVQAASNMTEMDGWMSEFSIREAD